MEPLTSRGKLLITTTGNASGIVRDNQSGADAYMSTFSVSASSKITPFSWEGRYRECVLQIDG